MNRVILSGRLTKDIEIKLTPAGTKVGNFGIAVNRKKRTGEEQEVDFFNCVCFNKTAEFLEKWSGKGLRVEIEGRAQIRSWQDQETGQKRTVTEILVEQVEPIDWKKETQEVTQPSYNDTSYNNSNYNEPSYDVGDLPF